MIRNFGFTCLAVGCNALIWTRPMSAQSKSLASLSIQGVASRTGLASLGLASPSVMLRRLCNPARTFRTCS